jgi:hypothetical protein
MRVSRSDVSSASHALPDVRFEEQELTSFGGLVLLQGLDRALGLRARLQSAVRHLPTTGAYSASRILLLLIVHMFLGWRRLRDLDYYRGDPLVKRVVGLHRLPDVSTVSRRLGEFDVRSVGELRCQLRQLVGERARSASPSRLTLDFDGSVLSTKARRIEGTAVGYNTKRKGARSYYPLFATMAQTGQVYDVLHRPGNCHDSRSATEFIASCIQNLRKSGFSGVLEARLDGAHFSDATCSLLDDARVEFSISVPFERLAELKAAVESRRLWSRIDEDWSAFELCWRPSTASKRAFRCVVYRQRVPIPKKGPIQLDLFEPIHREYEYKAVITNKRVGAATLLQFHNGRGSQEAIFAELKSQVSMEYLPSRRLIANQVWLLCSLLAHALSREIQMRAAPPRFRGNTPTRACLWLVDRIDSVRKRVIQRAARLTHPAGKLVLTLQHCPVTAREFMRLLDPLRKAAA